MNIEYHSFLVLQTAFDKSIIKCRVQLELANSIEWILLSSTRPERHDGGKADAQAKFVMYDSDVMSYLFSPVALVKQRRQRRLRRALIQPASYLTLLPRLTYWL